MWMILVVILVSFAILLVESGEKKLWKKIIAAKRRFKLLYGRCGLLPRMTPPADGSMPTSYFVSIGGILCGYLLLLY